MNPNTAPSTPLNRLILLVLCLNLVCLSLLLYRSFLEPKRSSDAASAAIAMPAVQTEPQPNRAPAAQVTSPRPPSVQRNFTPATRADPSASQADAAIQAVVPPALEQIAQVKSPPTALVNLPAKTPSPGAPPSPATGLPEVVGRVFLQGARPPEIVIDMGAACGSYYSRPVTTRHYLGSPDGGLANVLVWLKGEVKSTNPLTHSPAPVLSIRACMFEPYVMGVLAGQKFKVINQDDMLHNLHVTPKDNREFNSAMPRGPSEVTVTFPKPELGVRLKCDVHPWEIAYVHVMEHPFFAITDTNGFFRLPTGFPPGHYVVAAGHIKAGTESQELDLRPGLQEISFQIHAPNRAQARAR